jgi:mRNA interferase MazF
MQIRRGAIFFVDLDPVVGREIGGGKRRPVAVLSINDISTKPLVVTVVPGTKAGDKPVHYRNVAVVSPTPANGPATETLFQCHQIRSLDRGRFTAPPVGSLSAEDMLRIEKAVRYSLGLGPGPI